MTIEDNINYPTPETTPPILFCNHCSYTHAGSHLTYPLSHQNSITTV